MTRLNPFIAGITALIAAGTLHSQVLPARTADTAVLRIIRNLQPNEGVYLPKFACVDRYNGPGFAVWAGFSTDGPGTRDYCNKWVYAPSRGRALYCGSNHGAPHKFNDVWEYDLASNAWILLHKPDSGVVPCHTWWGLTYDRKREKLLWASGGGCGSWINWHVYEPYAPQKGWDTLAFSNAKPGIGLGATFEYLEDRDRLIWYFNDWSSPGMFELNPVTGAWSTLIRGDSVYHNCPSCPPYEQVMVYDSSMKTLIAGRNANIYECNLAEKKWRIAATDSAAAFHDANGSLVWDTEHRFALWYGNAGKLFGYNPRNKQLARLTPSGSSATGVGMAFYHESLKVMVVYVNRTVPAKIWVYRPPQILPATVAESAASMETRAAGLSIAPNPGNAGARITAIADGLREAPVSVRIYDAGGMLINEFKGKTLNRRYSILWDGLGQNGAPAASGVYIVRFQADNRRFEKKIIIKR